MPASKRILPLPAIRELVRDESDGKLYRIVLAGGGAPDVVLCHIYGARLQIKHIPITEFQNRVASDYTGEDRLVHVEKDPFDAFSQVLCTTQGHVDKSQTNWNCISRLVNNPHDFKKTLYSGATRRRIFEEYALEQGISLQRFRRLHRQYLQAGMTQSGMSSNLWRCGRKEQPARPRDGENAKSEFKERKFDRRPGRKPSQGEHYAIPSQLLNRLFAQYVDIYLTSKEGPWTVDVPDELKERIRQTIRTAKFPALRRRKRRPATQRSCGTPGTRRWPHAPRERDGKRRRPTMQDMVDHLNYVCRCTREVKDVTGQVVELSLAPFEEVTLRQFQHYWLTQVPIAVRKRRAMGERQYLLTGSPSHGHALQHCLGPGSEFMVDATVADVFLVSRFDRTVVVGRPTVYLAIDVWSRMIVGLHVTLDPPSFEGVALVLENIATPKEGLCARYGLTIDPHLWPCHHLPSIGFVADHGGDYLKADAWRTVTQRMHLSISNVRVRDPRMRALIERRFGSVPFRFQRASFGVVEQDAATRGAPHYAWDATDTMSEFTKKLLRACLAYIQTPIGREGAEPEMIFRGVADTPINRWHWGMDNLTGSLRTHSLDEIRMAAWPHATAISTNRGLEWEGVYYTSPYIEDTLIHCWGNDTHRKVPIQFNPDNISQIILAGRDRIEYGYQSGTNKKLPGEIDLMQWKIQGWLDRANRRKQNQALQPQRVMENLNNMQESRSARQEQQEALNRAGLAHPEAVGIHAARERERRAAKMQQSRAATTGTRDSVQTSDASETEAEIAARVRRNTLDLLGD